MYSASEIATIIEEIVTVSSTILPVITSLDPAAAVPAGVAEELATLAAKALAAWSAASGVPVTADSVKALLPNPAPLTPPDK